MRLFSKNSDFPVLYHLHDEMGKGRCVMLFSVIAQVVISWLASSIFYTSFLLQNGINLVNIGIITFVPYIANCFSVFAPYILERFEKRKWLLAGSRLAYYTLNILAITVIPPMISDPTAKITAFVILTFLAGVINAMTVSGYSAWHLNFIPGDLRVKYFSTVTTASNFVGLGAALVAALISDALSGSPHEYTIALAVRYIAYALGVIEVLVLVLPKEFPYPHSSRPRISDIFVKPLRHKKFMLTMLVVLLYNIGVAVTAGCLNAYLLDTVGVKLTFITVINFLYPVALAIFGKWGQRNIRRMGWFKAFAVFLLLQCPTTVAYACVNSANFLILIPVVRIIQHVLGATINVAYQNLCFINSPKEDQTNYLAFNNITANLGYFIGISLATAFIDANPTLDWNILGLHFCNVQVLMLVWALSELVVPLVIFLLEKKYHLEPAQETEA